MKIEIIKEELKEIYAGDILSMTTGYENYTYLLFEETETSTIGAIDVENGQVEVRISSKNDFMDLIHVLEGKIEPAEYKVFSNNEVKLVLGRIE